MLGKLFFQLQVERYYIDQRTCHECPDGALILMQYGGANKTVLFSAGFRYQREASPRVSGTPTLGAAQSGPGCRALRPKRQMCAATPTYRRKGLCGVPHTILSLVTFHKTCVRICEVALKPNSEQRRSGSWVALIGLDPAAYGTHSLRRTKATLIYRRTRNLWAVQLLLGHTKLESTVRYLGIEVDDVLEIAEQTEV
jgi:hypothetical protein